MAILESSLAQQVKSKPKQVYRVIVRVEGDMDAREKQLQASGFTISRRLKLIRGFGSSAAGTCIRRAMRQEWIISIEPDSQLQTMQASN